MKNLVKVVNIHDGTELAHFNAERLYIESHPRAERIIAAFLDDGWTMADCIRRYNPAVAGRDPLTFFLGGWELVFVKTVDDDQEDNGDEIITGVLRDLGYPKEDSHPDEYIREEDLDELLNLDEDEDDEDEEI